MRRLLPLALTTLALVAVPAGTAGAATPVKCNKLAGKNLAKNGKVKVVRTKLTRGRSRLFGCVLPRGAVHPLGSLVGPDQSGYDTSESIKAVRGTFVAVDVYGTVGQTSTTFGDSSVYNLATGKSYSYDSYTTGEEGTNSGEYGQAVKSFLDAKGRVVASYTAFTFGDETHDASEATSIVSYSSTGKAAVLDKGDAKSVLAESLKLVGATASWTSGGTTRTTTLP